MTNNFKIKKPKEPSKRNIFLTKKMVWGGGGLDFTKADLQEKK